jgi:hypothetical protein
MSGSLPPCTLYLSRLPLLADMPPADFFAFAAQALSGLPVDLD